MSDLLPEANRDLYAARGRSLRLRYRLNNRDQRIAYERAAVRKMRALLAPEGTLGKKWEQKRAVRQLNMVLGAIPIVHASDAIRPGSPLSAADRHPALNQVFVSTHQVLRQSSAFSPRGTFRDFVRAVDILTPDASDEDRLRIVADALSAYGIAASVVQGKKAPVTPGTIFVEDQPFSLPDLTPNQPGDIPEGWITSYAQPLRFEHLSPVQRIQ